MFIGKDDRVTRLVHIVARGESLWKLAERYFGDGWDWFRIWRANRWIDDPNLIHPGQELVIDETV